MSLRFLIMPLVLLVCHVDAMAANVSKQRRPDYNQCESIRRTKYPGVIVVVSGPSGVGKSVAMRKAADLVSELVRVPSVTTRGIRTGEKEGEDYFFVSDDSFDKMMRGGALLEHAQVYGNKYGLSRDKISQVLASGKDVIVDTDWQGAKALRHLSKPLAHVVTIYLLPPSIKELYRRLSGRGTDNADVINARMKKVVDQLQHYESYDYVVMADEIDSTAARIATVYKDATLKASTCHSMPMHAASIIKEGKEMIRSNKK